MAHRTIRHPRLDVAALAVSSPCSRRPAASDSQAAPCSTASRILLGAIRGYWTDARMRAAEPVDAPTPPAAGAAGDRTTSGRASYVPARRSPRRCAKAPRSAPRRGSRSGCTRRSPTRPPPDVSAHGKVFFTIPSGEEAGDYVCSGTAVNSRKRNVVWTAGHCVFPEAGGGFATNWTFIPAYDEGAQPYGAVACQAPLTTGPWQESANIKYDLGAAVVRLDPEGQRLQDVVGAEGIGFDQPRDQLFAPTAIPPSRR